MRHIITTQYTPEDFKTLIENAVKEALEHLIPDILNSTNSPPAPITSPLLSTKQCCALLSISRPSLIKLQVANKIKPLIIGGAYKYKKSDIEKLINGK